MVVGIPGDFLRQPKKKQQQRPNSDETSSKYNKPPISGYIDSVGPEQGHVNWQNCQKKNVPGTPNIHLLVVVSIG